MQSSTTMRHVCQFLPCLFVVLVAACASGGAAPEPPTNEPTGASLCQLAQRQQPNDIEAALRSYRAAAELEYAPAYRRLADIYSNGQGVPIDTAEVAHWLTRSAEAGDIESRYDLGCLYYTGRGVAEDPAIAAHHWRIAAEQGFASAQTELGSLYQVGEGVPQDHAEAARYFRMAAERGDATGQHKLAVLYSEGRGVEKDERAAFEWFWAAASQGDKHVQYELATCLERGVGCRADPIDAALWYWRAAQQGAQIAIDAFARLDTALRAAAGRGEAVGQRFLALTCSEGIGRSVDADAAYRQLELAARQDDPRALMAVAHCLAEGIGVTRDLEAANQSCFRAAHLGDAEALYEYGVFVDDHGGYTAESHARAFALFERAAAAGHRVAKLHVEIERIYAQAFEGRADSQRDLGLILLRNEVLRHDFEQAVHWLRAAVAGQDMLAQFELGMLLLRGGDTVTFLGRRTHAPDARAAVALLETPASYGNTEARTALALAYSDKKSGVYDLRKAMDWVDLAAVNGDLSAVPAVQAAYDAEAAAERARHGAMPRESDPMTPTPCAFCSGTGLVLQSRGQFINGNYWPDTYTTCLECKGSGRLFH